jgi:hypothetical protein
MAGNSVLAKMAVIIDAQTAAFRKALSDASSQLNKFGNSANSINKTLAAFGVGFGIYEIARGVKAAIGIMADFEATMSEVRAITGATGEEFQKLEADAKRLGASTKFTATQVAKLQVAYGRLGFTTKEILDATEATLNLAAATGEDLAKSADVAGSTVRGFGLNAKETGRVVDVMASSFNKTALGLENFTESMKYVAPVANAAGATVEETTALLGVLADAGIRGSMAGTSLRKIFTDLTKDGRPLSVRLAELAARGLTLQDSMDEVGRTAQTSLLILSKNTGKVNDLAAAFRNANGEAAEMAAIMQDNLTGDVTKLTSAFEGLILKIGNSRVFRDFTKSMTAILNAMAGVPDADGLLETIAGRFPNDKLLPDVVADDFIKMLAKMRKEAGRPISTDAVERLANAYGLTSEQANQLYRMVLEANKALSFQETAIQQFNDFATRNGYTDLTKAADDYKQSLYELILAEEIKKRKLEKSNRGGGFNDGAIRAIDAQIAAYRRVIRIINEYSSGFEKVQEQEKVQPPIIQNLKYYRDLLKQLVEEYDNLAASFDENGVVEEEAASRFRVLGFAIDSVRSKIRALEAFMREKKDLTITVSTEAINRQVADLDTLLKRNMATMDKYIKQTEGVKKKLGEIDLSGPIASGISSIAEAFGEAAVGAGNFGESILKAIGAFARQMGEAMIALGTAAIAAKLLIKNPYTAIAAGVALVAISGALSASLNRAQSNFNSGGGGGGFSSATPNPINYTTGERTQLSFEPVNLRLEGQALTGLLKVQEKRDGRNRG